jgi:hypothetical protein
MTDLTTLSEPCNSRETLVLYRKRAFALGARLTKGAKQPNDWEQGWNGYGLTLLIDVMASRLVVPESLGLSVFISECP